MTGYLRAPIPARRILGAARDPQIDRQALWATARRGLRREADRAIELRRLARRRETSGAAR